jgi:hypothetical protein
MPVNWLTTSYTHHLTKKEGLIDINPRVLKSNIL